MYIVVWTTRCNESHWEAQEGLVAARERYAELIARDDTYTASYAAVIESTDYEAP